MSDIYKVTAGSVLQNRAFSVPQGAELRVEGIEEKDFPALRDKLIHIVGDVVCRLDGKEGRLSALSYAGETLLTVPASPFLEKERFDFYDLIYIIHRLRDEDGCEWDKAQTHESIRSNAVEEALELVEAINNKDIPNMQEETGDVLLQGAFHAVIAEDGKEYDIYDVLSAMCKKLIFRHPHVFGTVKAANAEEALAAWEAAKMKEKKQKNVTERMTHIAGSLPQTMRAAKVQKYAATVGFDFASAEESAKKVSEELAEFLAAEDAEKEMEGGDLLFAAINTLRKRGVNPEMALLRSVDKFVRRFSKVEERVLASGRKMQDLGIEELDRIYEEVKGEE